MKTKEIINKKVKIYKMEYLLSLPEGLKVEKIDDNSGQYWLDEFPSCLPNKYSSFPRDSFIYHDAVHYGIRLNDNEVQE